MVNGSVYLIGGGPGDPGLLTLKAKRCLEEADAVVYDRLLSPRLLTLARKCAEFHYVGKAADTHAMSQSQIEFLLIRLAREGKSVVRLKGGDPFVFGRGGEEALALQAAGIRWEVVPGVTSAISVPAYAGIPITHRGVAPSFTVVTGHGAESRLDHVDWTRLADSLGTLVILMGVSQLAEIVQKLMAAGKPESTPIALIRWGTRAAQQTVTGTLSDIVERVRALNFQPPACIIVGEVVALREQLAWFESLPLYGKRVLVCDDTEEEAGAAADALEALGAETLTASLERVTKPNLDSLQFVVQAIEQEQASRRGIFFTTSFGVNVFFQHWFDSGRDIRQLASVHFGASTKHVRIALQRYGILPSIQHTADCKSLSMLVEAPPVGVVHAADRASSATNIHTFSMFDFRELDPWAPVVRSWVADGCDAAWVSGELAQSIAESFGVPVMIRVDDPTDVVLELSGRQISGQSQAV